MHYNVLKNYTMHIITSNSATYAYHELLDLCKSVGLARKPRLSNTLDLHNVAIVILNPRLREIDDTARKLPIRLQLAEFAWYMTHNQNVDIITKYLPAWSNFSDNGKTINSQYGAIWKDQVPQIIQKLRDDPETRRAVIAIYDKSYAEYDGKDTPCTLSLHFAIYDNQLHMTVTMRSNDIVRGFCIDQFCFTILQELIANELGIELGTYTHIAHSMHLYDIHFDLHAGKQKTIANDKSISKTTTYSNFWSALDPYFFDASTNKRTVNAFDFLPYVI